MKTVSFGGDVRFFVLQNEITPKYNRHVEIREWRSDATCSNDPITMFRFLGALGMSLNWEVSSIGSSEGTMSRKARVSVVRPNPKQSRFHGAANRWSDEQKPDRLPTVTNGMFHTEAQRHEDTFSL